MDAAIAKDFINNAITTNGAVPHTVHADRGASMTINPEPVGSTRTYACEVIAR